MENYLRHGMGLLSLVEGKYILSIAVSLWLKALFGLHVVSYNQVQ